MPDAAPSSDPRPATANGRSTAPASTNWYWRLRYALRKTLRSILMLNDTPESIGRGCAAGLFASTLPIVFQTVIAVIAAKLVRGNLLASIPTSWVSNPLTVLPIWYGGYRLGHALLPNGKPPMSYDDLAKIVTDFSQLGWADGLGAAMTLLGNIMLPLLLGTVLMGLVLAVLGWFGIPPLVAWMQRRRAERHRRWLRT